MCWVSKKEPEYKVAKEDIIVYKEFLKRDVCRENAKLIYLYSLFFHYLYKANEINETIKLNHEYNENFYRRGYIICKGYHSRLLNKLSSFDKINKIVVKCIIPKGSTFAINEYYEVVSSNIIVTDKIVN